MVEVVHEIAGYLPTAFVALVVGYWGYKNTRAGQQDTEKQQQRADRISETQQALDAQLHIAEQWKDAYLEERTRRIEAEADLRKCRELVRSDFEDAIRSVDRDLLSTRTRKPKNEQRKDKT